MAVTIDGTTGITSPGGDVSVSQSLSGNLTFTGTGNRIAGDFNNATAANRVMFQTSTTNGQSRISVIPNGTSDASAIDLFNSSSDQANCGLFSMRTGGGDMALVSNRTGTGTYLPMTFFTGGSERMRIDSSGRLLINASTTSGFFDGQLNVAGNSSFKAVGGSAAVPVFVWNNATSGNNQLINFYTETSATSRGNIEYNRSAGLVAYNTTSDYRAKDIISAVLNSGEVIDSVPVYTGKMKGATQERPMFIAHETPAYAHTGEKDAVDADGNPVYQRMDASALIPVMWAEIQSLRKRLATLESN